VERCGVGQTIEIEYRNISLLSGFEDNPRSIDESGIKKLIDSIKQFGLFKPLLVWENSGGRLVVIGGNQRLRALRTMKDAGDQFPAEIPTIEFKGSEKAARIIALRDNKSDGDWDWQKLPTYVASLTSMADDSQLDPELMGFGKEDLEDLIELAGSSDADLDRYSTAEDTEDAFIEDNESGLSPEAAAKDKVRKRFARFVIGNVRGRITVNHYGEWLEVFEKYSDRLGTTDIPVIFAAMLDDLEMNGRVGRINAD
jgi:hypothetical protein